MNNNNRGNNNGSNNNRRRGRGNNNRQQGGNAQQLNRVDSRARGNAPQMLEKYRKLAHDAHLNGDRVQEESFLQFADHYFRVIADQRQRQEDQRAPRQPGDRWQEGSEGEREESEDSGEYGNETEFQAYERQTYSRTDNRPDNRNDREDRPREERPREERPRQDREERPRTEREDRPREDRPRNTRQRPVQAADSAEAEVTAEAPEVPVTAYEPPENPFVRGSRGLRPRRAPRDAQDDADDSRDDASAPRGLDPAILPPPISATRVEIASDDSPAAATEAEEAPAPRRRTRRPRVVESDATGEALNEAS